jgi:hypothetical protein
MSFYQNATGEKFQNPNFGLFDTPTTIVDICGRILIWYLPGLMPYPMQVKDISFLSQVISKFSSCCIQNEVLDATTHISSILEQSRTRAKAGKTTSWRNAPSNFAHQSPTRNLPYGCTTFSAGWFAQAHHVSIFL